jgi:hypothetical protein
MCAYDSGGRRRAITSIKGRGAKAASLALGPALPTVLGTQALPQQDVRLMR